MATATAKTTLGNVFGMIGIAAGAITSTIETGVVGIEMLDRFAQKQSNQQQTQYALSQAEYEINLLDEMSLVRSAKQNEVLKFCNESPVNASLFKSNHEFFSKVLEDSKANKQQRA